MEEKDVVRFLLSFGLRYGGNSYLTLYTCLLLIKRDHSLLCNMMNLYALVGSELGISQQAASKRVSRIVKAIWEGPKREELLKLFQYQPGDCPYNREFLSAIIAYLSNN